MRSADVFPVVASLDDRKYVCASQASPYEVLQLVVIDNKVYHLQVKNDKGRGERAYGEWGGGGEGVGVYKKPKTRSKNYP